MAYTNPGLGHKTSVAIAKETAYGTHNVTAGSYRKFEVMDFTVTPRISSFNDPSLNSNVSLRSVNTVGLFYEFSFTVRVNYDGLEELFRAILPTKAFAASTPVSGTSTWTFKEATLSTPLNSYSMEVSQGDIPTTKFTYIDGSFINDVTIKAAAGTSTDAMLSASFKGISPSVTPNSSGVSTAVAPVVKPVLFTHADMTSTATWSTGTGQTPAGQRYKNFEVTITQPLANDRFYFGSTTLDRPVRSDFMTVKWKFTEEFLDVTELTAAATLPTATNGLNLQFLGDLITGATKRSLKLTSNSAVLTSMSVPITSYGVIMQSYEYDAYFNSGDSSAFMVTNINAVTTDLP